MKRTVITLIISVVVYMAAYIACDYLPFNGSAIDALVQTIGIASAVVFVVCLIVLLNLADDKR